MTPMETTCPSLDDATEARLAELDARLDLVLAELRVGMLEATEAALDEAALLKPRSKKAGKIR